MLGGLAAISFGMDALGGLMSRDDAVQWFFANSKAKAEGVKEKAAAALSEGFFVSMVGALYDSGFALSDDSSASNRANPSRVESIVRSAVGNYGVDIPFFGHVGMDEEKMQRLLTSLQSLDGHTLVNSAGSSSSSAPVAPQMRSGWFADVPVSAAPAPSSMQSSAVQPAASWWTPVYKAAQTVNANAQAQREKLLAARSQAEWQAKLPWIVGIGGTILVVSIALLAGSSE